MATSGLAKVGHHICTASGFGFSSGFSLGFQFDDYSWIPFRGFI